MELDKILIKYDADLSELKAEFEDMKQMLLKFESSAGVSSKKIEKGFKSADAAIDETNRSLKNLGATVNKTGEGFSSVAKKAQNLRREMQDVVKTGVTPLRSSLDILKQQIVATFAVGALVSFAKEAVQVTAKMEGLNKQLQFITGDAKSGTDAMDKLRRLTDELGLEFVSTADAYTKFAGAATKSGLALSEVDTIFRNVAIAAKAMNLSAENTTGVFLALQQMISKGTVAAEELRGQLSERLPGAFSLAAKSIGVTERELNKMLEQGQVISKEFLPAFSEQLKETFEGAMGEATDSLTSNLNRMQNAWTEFKLATGDILAPIVEGMAYTMIQLQNLISDSSVETTKEQTEAIEKNIQMYKEFGSQIYATAKDIKAAFEGRIADMNFETFEQLKQYAAEQKKFYTENVKGAAEYRKEAVRLAFEGIDKLVASQEKLYKVVDEVEKKEAKQIKTWGDFDKQTTEAIQTLGVANQTFIDLNLLITEANLALSSGDVPRYNAALKNMANIMMGINTEVLPELKEGLGGLNTTTSETLEESIDMWDEYAHTLLSLFDSFNTAYTNSSNYRLSVLEKELENGQISQETYDKKKKQILRGEAQREKAFSILSITLATARAIMNALGSLPPSPALAILAGITGAAQLGVAISAPIPAFKTGVIDFKGKGTETSDSNLVRISHGESVINAKATRKHRDLLEAINKDNLDKYLNNKYGGKDTEISWDDYRLLLAIQKDTYQSKENTHRLIQAIKEQRKPHRF